ncbi:MAG: PAS domain-containing protein, partial [Gemmatimonadota bacterium]
MNDHPREAGQIGPVSEEQAWLAVTAADLVTWDMDLRSSWVTCSDNALNVWGLAAGPAEAFFDRVHPDDRELAEAGARQAVEERIEYRAEYRVLGADSVYRWLHSRGRVKLDAAGNPVRFVGISADVTSRKIVESALRASEARFRSLALATSNAVWSLFADGRIGEGSSWWTDLTGQSAEESQNLGWLDVVHPQDRGVTQEAYLRALGSLTPFEIEYRVRSVEGSYRHLVVRGVPVEAGASVQEWVGTFTDVTERRQTQGALRDQEERLAAVLANVPDVITRYDRELRHLFMSDAITLASG